MPKGKMGSTTKMMPKGKAGAKKMMVSMSAYGMPMTGGAAVGMASVMRNGKKQGMKIAPRGAGRKKGGRYIS